MSTNQIGDTDVEWLAQDNPPEVTPINDLRPHTVGKRCWCKPFYDEDILVHNALDGRETLEFGRKMS